MENSKQLPDSWNACAEMQGIDPVKSLPDVSNCPEHLKIFTVDMFKRAIIVEALNKAAGLKGEKRWKPDYTNGKWDKNFPWGIPGKDDKVPSGFGFSLTDYGNTDTDTFVGSRLELRESDLVTHMWNTLEFRLVIINTMLIPDNE